ncbi:MAG: hypothetical protein MUE85_10125 [Microscillaceae bacterium]|jgi:hypothetical protein|nr:hypothetical protein [Microscillaceae bacterium]
MLTNSAFVRFAAIAGFLTVITTIGIHAIFPDPPAEFEARLLLYQNSIYLLNRWWIIVHCLLVLVAMWGFALVQFRKSAGFVGLGYLFFGVFAITEIARQMLVLFYLNGLRVKYLSADNEAVRAILKVSLDNFGLIGNSFFGLFVLAFGLGNLFYGLSLWRERGFSKILSWLLILWSIGSFLALGNNFWKNQILETFIAYYNFTYQPFMRALLAWWLWTASDRR